MPAVGFFIRSGGRAGPVIAGCVRYPVRLSHRILRCTLFFFAFECFFNKTILSMKKSLFFWRFSGLYLFPYPCYKKMTVINRSSNHMTEPIHPKKERTFVIVKPDGVQRSLVGEIIRRIERTGLKIVALKMVVPTEDQCWKHYAKDDTWFQEKGERISRQLVERGITPDKEAIEYGKDIIRQLAVFMTSGPVVALVVEGNRSVDVVKKLVGGTEPSTSDIGTIRGDFTIDSYDLSGLDQRAVRNLAHCSDKPEEAEREIVLWFDKDELIPYRLVQEAILYDVNLDGILE